MDFVVGLPRTAKGYDSIWVVVDRLTKTAHFLLVDTRCSAKTYAKLYFDRIVPYMEFLLLSSLIEHQSLSLVFGSNSKNVLVLVST